MKQAIATLLLVLALATAGLAMGSAPQPPSVAQLQPKVQAELDNMERLLRQAAIDLAATDRQGPAARQILLDLHEQVGSAIVASTISPDGILLAVEPAARYPAGPGQSVTDQALYQTLKRTGQPTLSGMFKAVEGFQAVALGYPIVSPGGKISGFTTLLIQPDALVRKAVADLTGTGTFEAVALQLNGEVIYDKDILQVGKMTFSDAGYAAFPSLIVFARRVTAEASGRGSYEYRQSGRTVTKEAEWATVGLHGTIWRLVVATPQ
ncbi:MAG: hypothetical protein MUC35_04560 [Candidatus Margulisbacteria bacterium]|jgi:hypothetical protein|nr:hypothetical protein [Candidatus Margulisiibacteriota bacterium]